MNQKNISLGQILMLYREGCLNITSDVKDTLSYSKSKSQERCCSPPSGAVLRNTQPWCARLLREFYCHQFQSPTGYLDQGSVHQVPLHDK